MGFGVLNLARMSLGGSLPGPVFAGNSGFVQDTNEFYDTVYQIPNPSEFALEMGGGITGDFMNPDDNVFNAPVNTSVIPTPAASAMMMVGFGSILSRRRRP